MSHFIFNLTERERERKRFFNKLIQLYCKNLQLRMSHIVSKGKHVYHSLKFSNMERDSVHYNHKMAGETEMEYHDDF